MHYYQQLDPLASLEWLPGSALWSTFFAAMPVVALFWLLVPRRWPAPRAGAAGALVAMLVAVLVYGMPVGQTLAAFGFGAAFGLLPVGWSIFNAMLLYNITVADRPIRRWCGAVGRQPVGRRPHPGHPHRRSPSGRSSRGRPAAARPWRSAARSWSASASGPFQAAVLCLIANTSPVAYGGLGTPLHRRSTA